MWRTNYTLGLGANRIAVYIIDTQNDAIINTYIFHLHRQKLGETSPEFAPYAKHQVCQQVQECDLLYLPGQPCGLFDSDYQSWLQLLDVTERLPTCRGLEKSGAWFVPCDNCSRSSSCYWRQSRWISNGCKDRQIPRSKLKECFASKKLLFIGDSTNRGIMHYIMEQINGTLTEWDKTHNIKVYDYLNDGRTSTSFAYYPQFWLPQDKRPGLEKALQQLVKRSVPLHNDSRTVFVIGGVQWLAMHHLNLLRSTLNRVGLSGAKLVIKSHGAGFHQPVNGMRTISVGDFQTLHSLNQDLLNHGRRLGYNIVDTYGITMARYKDFMQGKCACHFHKIVENSNSSTRLFHVDGDINAIYSEMIVNRICDWPS
ncbi:cadherin-like and PC-esterase domain-containing protein 1 [Tubulanus polymorphus]|uniref:cadherin-like and PC-esterase domain-containing protein 1 n=1 Tax=Tubulanus polymorphus TaxID=672921 RepID=UPI003DA233C2